MEVPKDTLLFIDVTCPKPYDPNTLNASGQGGTESTVTRLAEALGALDVFNVVIEQHNRFQGEDYRGRALYTGANQTKDARWVVVLRDPRAMVAARARFPDAKIYLFSHDLADRNLGLIYSAGAFRDSGCLANICVSDWHKRQSIEVLKAFGYTGQFRTSFIYNPLAEEAVPSAKPYDKNKLIWLSSPHKGISRAYEIFHHLLKFNPDFRLYVTNPGYCETQYTDNEEIKSKVVILGSIRHSEALEHLRDSLCLFYPNTVFPETFGMVLSEANAVNTPVLTHRMGAAPEVLDTHPAQLVDCNNNQTVIERVLKWNQGERPIVRGNPKFKLSMICQEWVRLLSNVR